MQKNPNKPITWKFVMFFLCSGSSAFCFSSLVYLRLTLESNFLPIQKVLRDHYPVVKWPECEDEHSSIQFVCKQGFTFTHTTCPFDQEITPVITHHHDVDWCLLQQYQHQHLVLATRIHCQKQPVPTGRGKKKKNYNESVKKTVSSEFTFKYSLPLDHRNVCSVCLTPLHCL